MIGWLNLLSISCLILRKQSTKTMNLMQNLQRLYAGLKNNVSIEIKTPEESLGIDSDTYNKIVDAHKLGELESLLDEWFDGEATITQINDTLWFESEDVLEALGLKETTFRAVSTVDDEIDNEEEFDNLHDAIEFANSKDWDYVIDDEDNIVWEREYGE